MASQRQIYNLAFSHLGEPTVDNITDDPAPANVVKANAQWHQALDVACAKAPWLRCLERLTLARATTAEEDPVNGVAGDFAYPYVYMLPVETLRTFYVDDCRQSFAWEESRVTMGRWVGRSAIRADYAGPLKVAIVRRTIPELLSPLLCDALGLELAARLAGPIQSDMQLGVSLTKRAEAAYAAAMGSECGAVGGQAPLFGDPMGDVRRGAW